VRKTQVLATFCSGLPNDAFGEKQGRTEKVKKEEISLLREYSRHP
jgi:hypothetical protein